MSDNIYCDSDFAQDVIIEDENGDVQDITGFSFELRLQREKTDKRICLTMGSGLALQDPTNGVLRITLTAAQTKDFGPGMARARLWRTDGMRKIYGEGSTAFEGGAFDA